VQQTAPGRLDVTQTTQKAVVNWDSFSVGSGAQVNFAQPGSGSVTLNRVTTPNLPSEILGRITANGQVWLVNPAGVFIGAGARIDVAGFLATTHDIADADFMAGNYRFRATDAAPASVENEGTITVAAAGLAALVAPHVANRGVIAARLGTAVLGAGEAFTVDLAGEIGAIMGTVDTLVLQDVAGMYCSCEHGLTSFCQW
jgi:filamentous hemagglutinin family protein